jgi:hypothetical protein
MAALGNAEGAAAEACSTAAITRDSSALIEDVA